MAEVIDSFVKNTFSFNLKLAVIYTVLFLLIFNLFFLQNFSDDSQTTNMFILISFSIAFVTSLIYLILKRIFVKTSLFETAISDAIALFILSEFVIFCFTGEICGFGIAYKLHFYNSLSADQLIFRQKRDFALSMSFLIAAILIFSQAIFFKSKKTDIAS
jgi:nitrate reductase gamma subunit